MWGRVTSVIALKNLAYSRAEIAADDDNALIYCRPEERSDVRI